MKPSQLALVSIMTTLLLSGCSKPESTQEVTNKLTALEKSVGQASEIARRAGDASQAVVEKAVDKSIEATGQTPEIVEKAKAAVIATTDRTVMSAEIMAAKTEAAAQKVSQQVAEKTAAATKTAVETSTAAVNKADTLVEKATEASKAAVTPASTTPQPMAPETITLENKKGKITLPHRRHSTTFACGQCHGDTTPGPFALGQEKGHALCKGCHQAKGGPTACNGCHEKKAIKTVEGC
jgi:hypothetical protein